MTQDLIAIAIVLAAAIWLACRWVPLLRKKTGCGSGCDHCCGCSNDKK